MGGGKSAECKWGEFLMPIDYLVTDTELSDIADAIRAKGGTSASISFPNGFTTAIAAIPTGITPTGTKQISVSGAGTVTEDVTNYANAEITTPAGTAGTPTATKGAVSNHSVSVTPSVTNTTGFITGSTKTGTAVSVSASELVSGIETKTANGTYDVTNLAKLIVNVSGGGGGLTATTYSYSGNSINYSGGVSGLFEPYANPRIFSTVGIYLDDGDNSYPFVCCSASDPYVVFTSAYEASLPYIAIFEDTGSTLDLVVVEDDVGGQYTASINDVLTVYSGTTRPATTVSFVGLIGDYYYVDSTNGDAHKETASAVTVCTHTVPSGSIIVVMWSNARNPDFSAANMTLVESVNMGSRANYKYVDIYQAS